MRRQIIILSMLLLAALPLTAQEWPEEMAGDQIIYQEPNEIEMYMSAWNDQNPWGMPSPVGHFFYFGSLTFDVCDGVNIADLDLDQRASRICREPPWGGHFLGLDCAYWYPRPIEISYTLEWDEDAQAYLVYQIAEWGVNVMALTMEEDGVSGILNMGVMEILDGKMKWDERYTWYSYVIGPKTAEPKMPDPRRFQRRLVR